MKQKLIKDYFSSKQTNKLIQIERLEYQNEFKLENPIKQQFFGQTFQKRHKYCTDQCLEFQNIIVKNESQITNYRLCLHLPLDECACFIEQTILHIKKCHLLKKCPIKKQIKKNIKRTKALTSDQRMKIRQLQDDGFKNSVIAYIMNVTSGQVRMNNRMLKIKRCTEDAEITFEQQKWITSECSKSTNVALFNAAILLKKFKSTFGIKKLSIFQFRKLLHELNISYRVPSLKPLQYFQKKEKNQEVYRYIESMCGYLSQGQKMIFIDECSIGNISKQNHKQWHQQGSFKQSFERNRLLLTLIAAIGDNNFLCFQLIEETGKSHIFKHFCQNLLTYANQHYQEQNFTLVLDNATIHKNQTVKGVLDRIPQVFTPPYRPDLNPIEHMFSWLKQYLVKEQPLLLSAYQAVIHRGLDKINGQMIQSWINSVFPPMQRELQYLI